MLFTILAFVNAVIDCDTCVNELVSRGGCISFVEDKVIDPHEYVATTCGDTSDCVTTFNEACKKTCKELKIPGCDYKACCVEKPLALCFTSECTKAYGYCCAFEDLPVDKMEFDLNPAIVPTADPSSRGSCETCVQQLVEAGGCEVYSDSQDTINPNSYVSKDCNDRTECSALFYKACEDSCKKPLIGCDYAGCCGDKPLSLCRTEACAKKYGYCCQIEVVAQDKNIMLDLNPAIIPTADPSAGLSTSSKMNNVVSPCKDCNTEFVSKGGCSIYAHDRLYQAKPWKYASPECNAKRECAGTTYSACYSYCKEIYIAGCDFEICCSDNPSAFCYTLECTNISDFCCDILSAGPMKNRMLGGSSPWVLS